MRIWLACTCSRPASTFVTRSRRSAIRLRFSATSARSSPTSERSPPTSPGSLRSPLTSARRPATSAGRPRSSPTAVSRPAYWPRSHPMSPRMARIIACSGSMLVETTHCTPTTACRQWSTPTQRWRRIHGRKTGQEPPGGLRPFRLHEQPSLLSILFDSLLAGSGCRVPNHRAARGARIIPHARHDFPRIRISGRIRAIDAPDPDDGRAEFPQRTRRNAYDEEGDPSVGRGCAFAQASAISARVANHTPSRHLA